MAFEHQVAGHASSIQASPSGSTSTLIKPSSPTEHAFYAHVGPSLHPDLVGTWTPAFFGTLTLQGKLSEDGKGVQQVEGELNEMLVLENLTFRFLRPNVLDVKLGTQLYDEAASAEKQARMAAASASTTSGTTGVRLTGFKVWDAATNSYINTPKAYGKSLQPADLPTGIQKFFQPFLEPNPSPHLGPVLESLLAELDELIALWEKLEVRMRGGSLLIVVEGDREALGSALERKAARDSKVPPDEDLEEDDEDGSDASSTDSSGAPKPASLVPLELRLIDFAHFTVRKGSGPDEGVLLGLTTVRTLLRGVLEML